MHKFRYIEVFDPEMLKRVFAFRYEVLLEKFPQYIENANLKDGLELDKYDSYAVQFVALDENDNIAATVRLIHNSPIGYPTENNAVLDSSMFERDKLGEFSRIFIAKEYRKIKISKIIMKGLMPIGYDKVKELGIDYLYGSLEPNFLKLLQIYTINYQAIAPLQEVKFLGTRYPCILYTNEFERRFNEE